MGLVHTGKNYKNLIGTNKFLQKFVTYFENVPHSACMLIVTS